MTDFHLGHPVFQIIDHEFLFVFQLRNLLSDAMNCPVIEGDGIQFQLGKMRVRIWTLLLKISCVLMLPFHQSLGNNFHFEKMTPTTHHKILPSRGNDLNMTSTASSPSFEVVHKSVPKKEFELKDMEDYDDDYYVDSVGESHMKSNEDYIDEVQGRLTFLKIESSALSCLIIVVYQIRA